MGYSPEDGYVDSGALFGQHGSREEREVRLEYMVEETGTERASERHSETWGKRVGNWHPLRKIWMRRVG